MLLSTMETIVRQDLFDPAATRWSNGDIDRAIDKAVDRYSLYYPNIVYTDMQTQPYQRTYPYPASWNASYPVLWIEKILYPLQVYGSQYAPPITAPLGLASAGTGLGVGSYQYAITFLTQGGETPVGPVGSITTTSGNQTISLNTIPIAGALPLPINRATNSVIGRNIYRTLVGGTTLFLLTTLPDNTTTTFVDTKPDSALSTQPQPPTINTSGLMIWPPRARPFSEYE